MLLVVTDDGLARVDGDWIERLDLPYGTVSDLVIQAGSLEPARTARVTARTALTSTELRCPVTSPRSIWGVGLNYYSKARLTGRAVPTEPILFVKAGSALAAPSSEVVIPNRMSAQVDYEAEVALLIGRTVTAGSSQDEAWASVAAITSSNDLTCRDIMRSTGSPLLAKSFEGFCPIGPAMRDTDGLASNFDIGVRTIVNGEVVQEGRTSDLIFDVAELLNHITSYSTLMPGDIVLTGTPAGTGQDRGVYLAHGDRVTVDVEGMLPLTNVMRIPVGKTSIGVPAHA
jgi:2-keto-4-pentenoate hydratase/2-oxohepta-3-ene-1,7-dioic acid hydratase in catechol pathway